MRISNIIGILGLAAMLFLVAIATGVAHADKLYWTPGQIEKVHDNATSITIVIEEDDGDMFLYKADETTPDGYYKALNYEIRS